MDINTIVNVAVESFGIFFCLVCIIGAMVSRDSLEKGFGNDFLKMFGCNAVILVFTVLATIFDGSPGSYAFIIVRLAVFGRYLFSYIMIGFFAGYVSHAIDSGSAGIFRTVIWELAVASVVLLFINLENGIIYAVDDFNSYHRGPLFIVSQIPGLFTLISVLVYLIINRKNASKIQTASIVVYAVVPVLAIIIQFYYEELDLLNMSILLALVFMFINIQSQLANIIVENEEKLLEKEKELQENRIRIMTSQIKPHFLYNSLTSIAQLCDDDPALAKSTTIAFSKYLRSNMNSLNQSGLMPFSQELDHVKNYLKIEQIRFGELLNIEYDIRSEKFEIPVLTVQPIVENAVKHGVGMKKGGGTVKISTYEDKSTYFIEVKDDGVGFDKNEIVSDPDSIGLENTRIRLKEMCNAAVVVESEINKGTTVTIVLPKERD